MIYLLAINPLPLADILNGDKDIEMRLNEFKPGDEIHLYCTKGKPYLFASYATNDDGYTYRESFHTTTWKDESFIINGKVVAKFIVGKVLPFGYFNIPKEEETMEMLDERSGEFYTMEAPLTGEGIYITSGELARVHVSYEQVVAYAKKRTVYGMTVTNLVVFDKPREISEYRNMQGIPLTHAPQSFQRVYPEE